MYFLIIFCVLRVLCGDPGFFLFRMEDSKMKVKGLNCAGRSFLLPLVIGLLLLASVVKNSIADTSVSGYITSDTTWTKANSPYVAGNVIVNSGVTLTIEQGVTVKFSKSS